MIILVMINLFDFASSGKIFPSGIAADSYKKAVDSAIEKLRTDEANHGADVANLYEPPS